ncbi:MAG: hypothetical protein KAT43_06500 [Nanoarchaeota archaeon]|nr:hypothetical protein [Nanoarchaeota archaeon]
MNGKYPIILFIVLAVAAVGVFSFASGFPDEIDMVYYEEEWISSSDAEMLTGGAVEEVTGDPIIEFVIKPPEYCNDPRHAREARCQPDIYYSPKKLSNAEWQKLNKELQAMPEPPIVQNIGNKKIVTVASASNFITLKRQANKFGVKPVKKTFGTLKKYTEKGIKKITRRAKKCRKVCKKKVWGKCIAFYYKCW